MGTYAQLQSILGTPAHADEWDLDRQLEPGLKATGVGSIIPIGRVAFLTQATGLWAIAGAASVGRYGVIPKLDPRQTETSARIWLVTGPGAETYVEANGPIKPNAILVTDAGGKVKAKTTESPDLWFAEYRGHYGQGSGGEPPVTDAIATDPIRVRLIR
jgi:hypothetical protein